MRGGAAHKWGTRSRLQEPGGEGVPGVGHSDGDGECDAREHERGGRHGGAMDAPQSDELKREENEEDDSDAGHGSGGGRKADAIPGESAEGGADEARGSDEDEALVCVWPAARTPGSEDDDAEGDDANQWNGKGDRGLERTDPNAAA